VSGDLARGGKEENGGGEFYIECLRGEKSSLGCTRDGEKGMKEGVEGAFIAAISVTVGRQKWKGDCERKDYLCWTKGVSGKKKEKKKKKKKKRKLGNGE